MSPGRAEIAARTLRHYDQHAEDFRAGTRDHDVSQNIAALLRHIEGTPPFTILDLGCGPGRDLKAFAALGHHAIGLEGAARFVGMARAETGCTVWQQDFLALDLPDQHFDGVFANAALFHVPSRELPRVLRQLHATLEPGGVLFSSNPRGTNEEGWNHGRYGVYHDLEAWRQRMSDAEFIELEHYYRPAGLPRDMQPWLASVWRKPAIRQPQPKAVPRGRQISEVERATEEAGHGEQESEEGSRDREGKSRSGQAREEGQVAPRPGRQSAGRRRGALGI